MCTVHNKSYNNTYNVSQIKTLYMYLLYCTHYIFRISYQFVPRDKTKYSNLLNQCLNLILIVYTQKQQIHVIKLCSKHVINYKTLEYFQKEENVKDLRVNISFKSYQLFCFKSDSHLSVNQFVQHLILSLRNLPNVNS